jgi:hypothetical protein
MPLTLLQPPDAHRLPSSSSDTAAPSEDPAGDLDDTARTVRTTFEALLGGADPLSAWCDDTTAFGTEEPLAQVDIAALGIRVRTVEVKSGLHRCATLLVHFTHKWLLLWLHAMKEMCGAENTLPNPPPPFYPLRLLTPFHPNCLPLPAFWRKRLQT